jgi:hypothetical protein
VRDQVLHPYNTTGKIAVLYILIFRFFDIRQEDKRFWTQYICRTVTIYFHFSPVSEEHRIPDQ